MVQWGWSLQLSASHFFFKLLSCGIQTHSHFCILSQWITPVIPLSSWELPLKKKDKSKPPRRAEEAFLKDKLFTLCFLRKDSPRQGWKMYLLSLLICCLPSARGKPPKTRGCKQPGQAACSSPARAWKRSAKFIPAEISMVTDYTVKFQIIAAWIRGEVELTDSDAVQGCLKPTQKHPY